jgi:hypothetical protein
MFFEMHRAYKTLTRLTLRAPDKDGALSALRGSLLRRRIRCLVGLSSTFRPNVVNNLYFAL